jgi:hypothetical protein
MLSGVNKAFLAKAFSGSSERKKMRAVTRPQHPKELIAL